MKNNLPPRKIMETHTAVNELQAIYHDLLKSANELEISMPHYRVLKNFVDHPRIGQAV